MNNLKPSTLEHHLKKSIPILMQKNNIPGLALAMFKQDDIFLHLEFGVKNSKTNDKVVANTVFEGASLTKPLIAYGALTLCHDGKLSLDKPLKEYLKAPYRDDPPFLEQVTLRQVLFHTSGFPYFMLGVNERLHFDFHPGSQYGYSSASFNYLAFVMEQIIGEDIHDYLKRTILVPFDMKDTSFVWENRYESQAATPHNRKGEPVAKWKPTKVIGGCSIHTTAIDFAKFMMAILKQAKNKTPDAIDMLGQKNPVSKNILTSLGWAIEECPHDVGFYHVGNNVTFKAISFAYQEQELGVVVLTNSINSFHIFETILELTVGGKHKALADFEEFNQEDQKINFQGEAYLYKWWEPYGI